MGLQRRLNAVLQSAEDKGLPADATEFPDCIVLGPRPGETPSTAPPVRVFLGTEPAQYRAERVFVWSIEAHRDPTRTYEIHLMRSLAGFDRRRWLTGFTNYRFAIPTFAGGHGRAIYNDVDQIYLCDPAELFDRDMDEHGILTIPPKPGKGTDTSVMLIDCERMEPLWNLKSARTQKKKALLASLLEQPGLAGTIEPAWNARDDEYEEGVSRVLHYTILHTQPWRPLPGTYVYQHNPVGYVWHDLERGANEAGFQLFGPDRPSARWTSRLENLRANAPTLQPLPSAVETRLDAIMAEADAHTVMRYGLSSANATTNATGRETLRVDPRFTPTTSETLGRHDAIIVEDGLEWIPDEDVPWVLDTLFAAADRMVVLAARNRTITGAPADGPRSADWWGERLAAAGAARPAVHWVLDLERPGRRPTIKRGGRPPHDGPPLVWVLTDGRPGHTAQSVALAEALGWPFMEKELRFRPIAALHRVHDKLLGATRVTVDRANSAPLSPPWPDLVIAAGRRSAPVARWIRAHSEGRTRTVQLGRKGGHAADEFDVVVTPAHCRFPPHPHRVETLLPLNPVTDENLARAREEFRGLFDSGPKPHVALLVGGSTGRHHLDATFAREMGSEARSLAESAGGSVFAITSRRTEPEVAAALEEALGAERVHRWRPGETSNPYPAYLALADAIVVSGESESMVGDAVATGKPVYLYPVPERPLKTKTKLAGWIYDRSQKGKHNKRGTIRPQQGLEYLCAELVARGFIEPPRSLDLLHSSLERDGLTRSMDHPLEPVSGAQRGPAVDPPREVERVARHVRRLLGYPAPGSAPSPEREHAKGRLSTARAERLES